LDGTTCVEGVFRNKNSGITTSRAFLRSKFSGIWSSHGFHGAKFPAPADDSEFAEQKFQHRDLASGFAEQNFQFRVAPSCLRSKNSGIVTSGRIFWPPKSDPATGFRFLGRGWPGADRAAGFWVAAGREACGVAGFSFTGFAMTDDALPPASAGNAPAWNPDLIFSVLADASRRAVLAALARGGPQPASVLKNVIGRRFDATLKQLVLMQKSGVLVTQADRTDGRRMLYALSPSLPVAKSEQGVVMDFGFVAVRW
jgi:hypothetical protein